MNQSATENVLVFVCSAGDKKIAFVVARLQKATAAAENKRKKLCKPQSIVAGSSAVEA